MSSTQDAILSQDLDPESKLIFAFLGSRNIGDFTEQVVTAAAVKENLEGYRLAVFYNQDRPYKQQIISLCPSIDIVFAGPEGMQFPINVFDVYSGRFAFADPSAEAQGLNRSTIVLAGNSLPSMCLPGFDHIPRLRVPAVELPGHVAKLKNLGLDPDRWFACVYWREPNFNDRPPHPLRDIIDPASYFAAIDHIVDTLGGQVVRLGHPTNTELRSHPDILDIAKVEDSLMTQIAAVSMARFFIASPSGPLTFGSSFGTPTAVTDNIDISGIWNDDDILVTQTITAPDGRAYQGRSAFDAGFLKPGQTRQLMEPGSGYRYTKNTEAKLISVADTLYRRTTNCQAWRRPPTPAPVTGRKEISFPLRASIKSRAFF